MSAVDTSTGRPYVIIGKPIHENRWVEEAQAVVPGWAVRARWLSTGAIIPVFVPDDADLVQTVDQLVRHYGTQLDTLQGG